MALSWVALLALSLGAGARPEGLAGVQAAPLAGPWSILGNPAALGLERGVWAAFADFGNEAPRRYALVQGDPTLRGPAGIVWEEGQEADRWEVSFVLPDLERMAYGFDVVYTGGEQDYFTFDLNLATQFDRGLAVGVTVRDVAEKGARPQDLSIGASYTGTAGGLLVLEAQGVHGFSAESIHTGWAVDEAGFEYRMGIIWWDGGGRDWSLGIGLGVTQQMILDYAWSNGRRGTQHRFGVGFRRK